MAQFGRNNLIIESYWYKFIYSSNSEKNAQMFIVIWDKTLT